MPKILSLIKNVDFIVLSISFEKCLYTHQILTATKLISSIIPNTKKTNGEKANIKPVTPIKIVLIVKINVFINQNNIVKQQKIIIVFNVMKVII